MCGCEARRAAPNPRVRPRPARRPEDEPGGGRGKFVMEEEGRMETQYQYLETGGVPVKAWTRGVPLEDSARNQVENVAKLPFVHKHIAVMPDVHWGMGATVGSVIPTIGAIIPAAVGVDIGCGMAAIRTNLQAKDLPDNLSALRSGIEAVVPHGRTDNGGRNDIGAWKGDLPA